ncbi:MAG: PHP domain-containing protein [Candidatus Hydrogenedentes bacterium]|nr:PHP domain-containing protein [Candidatus Hydrogenedentota bacterium]
MPFLIDMHMHTTRYSRCSRIEPAKIISQAVRAGLDGIVITEHHHQWSQDEIDALVAESGHPGFLVMAGFEYTSNKGDILMYGVPDGHVKEFTPAWPPEKAMALAQRYGAACIAAHPTREGMSFDERIAKFPLAALEVASVNLKPHEQRLARRLAESIKKPMVACSDAHDLQNVGRYATEFPDLILGIRDLQAALLNGRFQAARFDQRTSHA